MIFDRNGINMLMINESKKKYTMIFKIKKTLKISVFFVELEGFGFCFF